MPSWPTPTPILVWGFFLTIQSKVTYSFCLWATITFTFQVNYFPILFLKSLSGYWPTTFECPTKNLHQKT